MNRHLPLLVLLLPGCTLEDPEPEVGCAELAEETRYLHDEATRSVVRHHRVEGRMSVRVTTHDQAGRLVRRVDDRDADGEPDLVERRLYAADGGRLERVEVDEDGDGRFEWWLDLDWDADGRLAELAGEGPVSFALVEQSLEAFYESYTYDFGPPLLPDVDVAPVPTLFDWAYDPGAPLEALRARYVYDPAGRATVRWDRGDDGVVDARREQTRAGLETRVESDVDGDGEVDLRHHQTHDAQGRLLLHAVDVEADGRVDRRRRFDRTDAEVVERRDDDGDGVWDRVFTRHLDDAGRLRLETRSRRGRLELRRERFHEADRVVDEIDEDGDGEVDRIHTRRFDARGRLVEERSAPLRCAPGG